MRKRRRATSSSLVLAVALAASAGLAGCSRDEEPSKPICDAANPADCPRFASHGLDGDWRLTAFRASGVWDKGAEADAVGFLGKHVTIDGDAVKLPNATKCRIVSAGPTIVTDSVETFGSRNGSWQRMGFTPMSEGLYKVVEVHFDCEQMFWGMVMQPENHVRLLRVWEVFLLMKKSGA